MTRQIETRTTALMVLPAGDPIFSEMATSIKIDQEPGGEDFVVIEQLGLGKVEISPEEWPALRAAINRMIKQCRGGAMKAPLWHTRHTP